MSTIPANISSIVDLLDNKGITWAEYQEDMPSTGFTGNSPNAAGSNDYVRKHKSVVYSVINLDNSEY